MPHYHLSKSIPLHENYDVIVAGGGPAGCTAAAAASREGAKTLLIEASGALGGMGTMGMVPAWTPFSDKEKIIYRGLAERVFNAVKAGTYRTNQEALDWVTINAELLKRVYDDLVTGAGATVLFQTSIASVEASEGSIQAVVTVNKSGLTAYRATTYVDCTGDADLATWAGSRFAQGDDSGEVQPATHCFTIANVNEEALLEGPFLYGGNKKSPIYEIIRSGKYPRIQDHHLCTNLIGPSTLGLNAGHLWDVDSTNPESISKALIEGRKLAQDIRDALAEFHPKAFANSFLSATAPVLGIRESRRIIGDYVLTVEDYFARRSFPDEICRNSYFIDIHTAKGEIDIAKAKNVTEHRFEHYKKGESHGIPYRCLCPKGVRNTLVAGRSISTERAVQGSTRVMPVCLVMGEAAGMAAAMAANSNGDVHAVDTERLRVRLKEEGAYLP